MKIEVKLSIGYPTAVRHTEFVVDDDDLKDLSEDERDDYLQEIAHDWATEHIDVSYEIV